MIRKTHTHTHTHTIEVCDFNLYKTLQEKDIVTGLTYKYMIYRYVATHTHNKLLFLETSVGFFFFSALIYPLCASFDKFLQEETKHL